MSGLDMSKGIPRGRPTRKMPKPFVRPRIELGRQKGDVRREWQWILPAKLVEGDIVPGYGYVLSVTEMVDAPPFESGLAASEVAAHVSWHVVIKAGVPLASEYWLEPTQQVWAYAVGEVHE